MRPVLLALACTVLAAAALAQEEERIPDRLKARYGITVNPLTYPQSKPEDALKSVVRALEKRRTEYLVAQLADPRFVDGRIAEYRESIDNPREQTRTFLAFERLQREIDAHFLADPQLLRELRLLARDAEWQVDAEQAVGASKEIAEHKVFMRRIGPRWFLENRQSGSEP